MTADPCPPPAAVAVPPTPARVARRAVALTAVTARAVIEREVKLGRVPAPAAAEMHDRLLAWAGDLGIDAEFEPDERATLAAPPGRLTDAQFYDAVWRVEGLEVLGWALGRSTPPRYDDTSNFDDVWNALGFLDPAAVREVLAAATLRPRAELEAFRAAMRGYHWRLRQFQAVGQNPIDFLASAAACGFGPLDAAGFDLIDGDLAVRGERLDRVPEEVFADAAGVAAERHLAAAWLCSGPEQYSSADVST